MAHHSRSPPICSPYNSTVIFRVTPTWLSASPGVLGSVLLPNFDNPYSARSIVEFWRRWHISFSRWIFDYVFNPLQLVLRDLRTAGIVIGLILTFLVSGVWHGIGWTFVVWGLLHGSYMAVSISTCAIRKRWHNAVWRRFPGLGAAWQVFATVHLVVLSWVFFRADSLSERLRSDSCREPAFLAPVRIWWVRQAA